MQDGFREAKQYTIEEFLNTTSVFGRSFSYDESKVLITSDASGIFNIYTVSIDGGDPVQLTFSDSDNVFGVSFFPNDDRILYMGDKGGNEKYHLYVMDEEGQVTDLTPAEGRRGTFSGWSHDRKSFFYETNERDEKFMDLYEIDLETMTPEMIFKNETGMAFSDMSPDKNYMTLIKSRTTHNTEMYLYDRQAETMTQLLPHEQDIALQSVAFSTDSKTLYYLTDQDNEFSYLMKYNLADGQTEIVRKADWEVMYAKFSHSGRYRVIATNEDASTVIEILDTETNKKVSPPKLPNADIKSVSFSMSEKYLAFYASGARFPSNLYVYNIETGDLKQLTDNQNPAIDPDDLVKAEVVRYKSTDGLEIPAILMKPHLKSGEKAPALVWVHGGPGGQSRLGYSSMLQYLVNHGYVILQVNNRGSSGYGKTFFGLDDRKHGKGDLDDCVAAKDYFASTGYVDTTRVGIIGGSYGGFMVLAALTIQPEAFDVGIDLFGVSNWIRTLENIPPWWEDFREALYKEMGNPETDREYLEAISPLFNADKIVKPLMVLQGANDPRVLQAESDEIVEAVKKNEVPVEYIIFDDEGHGFTKKENRIKGWKQVLLFLDKHLKAETI
jgi:dipeptidyl aminopeptidase/acylaminoacyl peptidase